MEKAKRLYAYNGPVYNFGIIHAGRWSAETWAVSEKSALNQLAYRYKRARGFCASSNFKLDAAYLTQH